MILMTAVDAINTKMVRLPCPNCKKVLEYYLKMNISLLETYEPVKTWTMTGKGGSQTTCHAYKCKVCGTGWVRR